MILPVESHFTKPKILSFFLSQKFYSLSFYAFSQALQLIPLSIAYAIWSGAGTALTAVIAVLIWKESINIYTAIGIILIISGVALLNIKGTVH